MAAEWSLCRGDRGWAAPEGGDAVYRVFRLHRPYKCTQGGGRGGMTGGPL